ncbi:MAG: hypothetical protein JOS17DRAFT_785455 [Linnemannia elongata]|nr:MAG: hypothetical protein JOS17DRAFT_785455 [Linnemannia elongata]
MDGVDCDWCLVCDKHTNNGATYCSAECRSTDLISSSASSSSSSASSASSTESSYFSMTDVNGAPLPGTSSSASSFTNDNYPMPPFIRKQRTSIPNIYHQCASNPIPPGSPRFIPGGSGSSALSHHLQQQQLQHQQQQQIQQHQSSSTAAPGSTGQKEPMPNSAASQYPLFYATLNALRPATPSGLSQQD